MWPHHSAGVSNAQAAEASCILLVVDSACRYPGRELGVYCRHTGTTEPLTEQTASQRLWCKTKSRPR